MVAGRKTIGSPDGHVDPFCQGFPRAVFRQTRPGSSGEARRFDAGMLVVQSVSGIRSRARADGMNFRWLGPLALLAVLVIADQVRINRPGHKYRLTVEVETPEGVKSASGILAVQPGRGYGRSGQTRTMGDAVLLDLGGGNNLIALLGPVDKPVEIAGLNYLALRPYNRAGRKGSCNASSRITGPEPHQTALAPRL